MGRATTLLFDGALAKMQNIPGAVIDFEALGRTLITLAVLYIASALFTYIQQYIMAE